MRILLATVAAVVIAIVVARAAAGRFLVVSDPLPAHADAIVVMAGSLSDRTLEAVDLYRAGVAPRVVVTRERLRPGDVMLRARGVNLAESDQLTRSALRNLGVPPDAIVWLRRRARSTSSEARTIARWACRNRIRSLVVVTSRTHTRRARMILRQSLGPDIALAVRPTRYDTFPPQRWSRIHHHAKAVLSEYEKLANYWLRERWWIEPCGGLRRGSR